MKLLVVLGFADYDPAIMKIFKQANILIFSKSRMSGYKQDELPNWTENWFSATRDEYEAIMFFAFTNEEKVDAVTAAVAAFNSSSEATSKIRAFVMNVEQAV